MGQWNNLFYSVCLSILCDKNFDGEHYSLQANFHQILSNRLCIIDLKQILPFSVTLASAVGVAEGHKVSRMQSLLG